MTQCLYLTDTYLFEAKARVMAYKTDETGPYVLLDRTIFYPQGGGQPFDQGVLQGDFLTWSVEAVRQVGEEIRHYIKADGAPVPEGQEVHCKVDAQRRLLNARYHTAAHLLGNVAEKLFPTLKAIKGKSFPQDAYVGFQGIGLVDADQLADKLQEGLHQAIAAAHKTITFDIDPLAFEQKFYPLPYNVPENKKFRAMQIESFPPIPCGGTHLATTQEIGQMTLGKIKVKSDLTHVPYTIR